MNRSPEKSKVLFLLHTFPSISETFVLNQIVGLIERGYDVHIYAAVPDDQHYYHLDVDKYKLLDRVFYKTTLSTTKIGRYVFYFSFMVRAPRIFIRSLRSYTHGKEILGVDDYSFGCLLSDISPLISRGGKYDHIIAHFGPNGLRGLLYKKLGVLQGKLITFFHGYDMSKYLRTHRRCPYQALFKKGDHVCAISSFWKKKLVSFGAKKSKTTVHRMGIDTSRFVFKKRALFKDEVLRLVSVCRLSEKKGLHVALRALAQLTGRCKRKISYGIIGGGPLEDDLKQLTCELGLESVVTFHGKKTQRYVVELLESAHIFLLPSITAEDGDMEGIPVVLMEAMAQGIPVISTYHSGIPELIEHGVSGFLVPEKDVSALGRQIEYVMENSHQWEKIGKAARSVIERDYDIDRLNARLSRLIQRS